MRLNPRGPEHDNGAEDVIVIGAGHNGLVAASYLAQAGLHVTVVEAAAHIGGCTTTGTFIEEAPEHRINPSAIDIIFLHASSIVADLELERFGFRERFIDPGFIGLDPSGASLPFWCDPRRTAEEIKRYSKRDARAYLEFAARMDAAIDVALPYLLTSATRPAPRNLLASAGAAARHPRRVAGLGRLATGTVAEVLDDYFEHPLVKGPLAILAGTAGSITAHASAVNLVAAFFSFKVGKSRIIGGTGGLPDSLAACLTAHGGRIRTSSPVRELWTRGDRVTGVRLHSGEELGARAVVSACDPWTTLTKLLPAEMLPDQLAARAKRIPTANNGNVGFKVDVALKGKLRLRADTTRRDDLDLRLPTALVGSLDEMVQAAESASRGVLANPMPFCGIIPSASDPSQAPEGQDTLYLWNQWSPLCPPEGWGALVERAGDELVAHATRYYEGIEEFEIGRFVEAWPELEQRTRVPGGNIYHVDMTPFRSGPLRPARGFANHKTPVPGLYLTGAGTHPGPAVSGVPGQLAARAVLKDIGPGAGPRPAVPAATSDDRVPVTASA